MQGIHETLKGVLGSVENGVKKYREQGAWGQRNQVAGTKESNLGSREQKILVTVSNNLKQFLGFFFASLRSANFLLFCISTSSKAHILTCPHSLIFC